MTLATTPPVRVLSGSDVQARSAYDVDFHAWTKEQAALLRAGRLSDADLENIAEEIEALGRAEKRSLASHVRTVVEHLMKLQASPATEPRAGWHETVRRMRDDIEDVLGDSPSLRRELAGIIARETERARRLAGQALAERGEPVDVLSNLTYDEGQVLGPWMPD
ncbi:MAG TPA: DUF29 domain-containing protein [Acetobacteraceae bacterium]|nr:DUF29 domain-containing protein [Acetobacteraceae bacterium]